MSIVAPRPLLRHEVRSLRDEFQNTRFRVRQGLTGLWQVKGRNSLPDEERMRLDEQYVERWSNILDLAIMMKSIPVVLFGIGAR